MWADDDAFYGENNDSDSQLEIIFVTSHTNLNYFTFTLKQTECWMNSNIIETLNLNSNLFRMPQKRNSVPSSELSQYVIKINF